jgi:hypothetical protein
VTAADKRAQTLCQREEATSTGRGRRVGGFATTARHVEAELRRLYGRPDSSLAAKAPDAFLALCYYDTPPGTPETGGRSVERVSIWVDDELNSSFVHGGTKASVPVRRLP